MRKLTWSLVLFAPLLSGCPEIIGPGPEAVLEGEWEATDSDGNMFDLTFDGNGRLVRIRGTNPEGQTVTVDLDNATTELDGSDVTITVPGEDQSAVFEGMLSDDENTMTGTLSRVLTVGDVGTITVAQGDVTITRDDGDDDNPAEVLAGDWDATDADGNMADLTFDADGRLVRISGMTPGGEDATVDITNSTSVVDGNDVTITIPVGDASAVIEGTLSADQNTITGTVSRVITVGDDSTVSIAQGDVTLTRDDDGDDDDDDDNGDQGPEMVFNASLDGAQETPSVETPASGTATVTLSEDQTQVTLELTAMGFTEPVILAHFHNAPAGMAGGVVFDLTGDIVQTDDMVTINVVAPLADFTIGNALEELLAGNLYLNLHTETNMAGEIRGQILLADDTPDDNMDGGGAG